MDYHFLKHCQKFIAGFVYLYTLPAFIFSLISVESAPLVSIGVLLIWHSAMALSIATNNGELYRACEFDVLVSLKTKRNDAVIYTQNPSPFCRHAFGARRVFGPFLPEEVNNEANQEIR